jgi:NAD-dependent deacetylase sirtuin 5
VLWFGEAVKDKHLERIDNFIAEGPLDLMLVVGTRASVYPAASYITEARKAGARVAYVDIAARDKRYPLPDTDWYFRVMFWTSCRSC